MARVVLAASGTSNSHAPANTNISTDVPKMIPDRTATRRPQIPAAKQTVAATVRIATRKLGKRAENSDTPNARYESAVSQTAAGVFLQRAPGCPQAYA